MYNNIFIETPLQPSSYKNVSIYHDCDIFQLHVICTLHDYAFLSFSPEKITTRFLIKKKVNL